MRYVLLLMAVVAEIIGTTALKATDQFTRPLPSLVVAVSYGVAFYLLTHVLKTMQVGVVYALWSGIGIALVVLFGAIVYRERPDVPTLLGIGLIALGVLVIHLFSKTATH